MQRKDVVPPRKAVLPQASRRETQRFSRITQDMEAVFASRNYHDIAARIKSVGQSIAVLQAIPAFKARNHNIMPRILGSSANPTGLP